jgi:hypothetical protein
LACAVELNSYGRGTQMHKIRLVAAAATSLAIGFGIWANSIADTRVATSIANGIEPFQIMSNAKQLPAQDYDDFSLFFRIARVNSGTPKIVHHLVRARLNCSAWATTRGIILNVAVC